MPSRNAWVTVVASFPAFDPARSREAVNRSGDGVFILPTISTAEDAETEDRLQRLNVAARKSGWREALVNIFGDDGNVDYVTSEQRLGFLPILPLQGDQAILEIGASLGQVAIPLARRVATVDGLEVVLGQARFCMERARQEGITNIRITAGGQDCRLPYANAGFDGVVLNLVLEWCADRADEDHEVVQQRLLGEIARVLKPGGFLFVQTKNRYGLRLLLGGRDEHMGHMRWGSALPRWLGRVAAKGRRDQGRLHSFPHLRRMLRRGGFSRVEGYWAVPEMRRPTTVVSLEPAALRAWRRSSPQLQGPSRSTHILTRVLPDWAIKYITPGLTFLAFRSEIGSA